MLNFPTQYGNWNKKNWLLENKRMRWTSPRSTGIEIFIEINEEGQIVRWTSPRSTGIEIIIKYNVFMHPQLNFPTQYGNWNRNAIKLITTGNTLNFPTQYGNWNPLMMTFDIYNTRWTSPRSTGIEITVKYQAQVLSGWTSPRSTGIEIQWLPIIASFAWVELPHAVRELKFLLQDILGDLILVELPHAVRELKYYLWVAFKPP